MLLIYVSLVVHTVLAFEYPRKEKVFYKIEDAEKQFGLYLNNYNKTYYSEAEKAKRFKIFKLNLIRINEINENHKHGVYGINQFTDLTSEEFTAKHTGFRPELDDGSSICTVITDIPTGVAPAVFDWKNISMPVKDQLFCGSCWAFSCTGNIESQYYRKHKKPILLSEQQLVDCDTSNKGCCGGLCVRAFSYLIQNGQALQKAYPYVDKLQLCKFEPGDAGVKVTHCNRFNFANENLLKEALFEYGPLSAAIDSQSLKAYRSGIAKIIPFAKYNHEILIVGYGRDKAENKDYWLIKNSWGDKWGEEGFARIERGVNATGILSSHIATAFVQ